MITYFQSTGVVFCMNHTSCVDFPLICWHRFYFYFCDLIICFLSVFLVVKDISIRYICCKKTICMVRKTFARYNIDRVAFATRALQSIAYKENQAKIETCKILCTNMKRMKKIYIVKVRLYVSTINWRNNFLLLKKI